MRPPDNAGGNDKNNNNNKSAYSNIFQIEDANFLLNAAANAALESVAASCKSPSSVSSGKAAVVGGQAVDPIEFVFPPTSSLIEQVRTIFQFFIASSVVFRGLRNEFDACCCSSSCCCCSCLSGTFVKSFGKWFSKEPWKTVFQSLGNDIS